MEMIGFEKVKTSQNLDNRGYSDLAITIKDGKIVATKYLSDIDHSISILFIEEGVFEGIDNGEFGGVVRFRPNHPENFISLPRPCPYCGSTTENCCVFGRISENPEKRNIFKGMMEGVDLIKYKGHGILVYVPRGDTSHISVLYENCLGFFKIGNRNFTITGLAHMLTNYGKIYELIVTQNQVVANKIVDIENQPESFLEVEDQKTVYIATRTSLLAFKDDKLKKLLDFQDHFLLEYPRSIVYSNRFLFIGITDGFLLKYEISTEVSELYQYTGISF